MKKIYQRRSTDNKKGMNVKGVYESLTRLALADVATIRRLAQSGLAAGVAAHEART